MYKIYMHLFVLSLKKSKIKFVFYFISAFCSVESILLIFFFWRWWNFELLMKCLLTVDNIVWVTGVFNLYSHMINAVIIAYFINLLKNPL